MSGRSLDDAPQLVVDPDLELGCPLGCSSRVTVGTLAAHIDDEHVLPRPAVTIPRADVERQVPALLDVLREHVEQVRRSRGE